MAKTVRWLVRIAALIILAAVWAVLPIVMPGASHLLRALQFCAMCAAVWLSCAALLATLIPATRHSQAAARNPKVKLDARTVAEALRNDVARKAWEHRGTGQ